MTFPANRFDPRWLIPALDDAPIGFLVEHEERIVYINSAYASYLGRRPTEVCRSHVSTVVHPEDADRLLRYSRLRTSHAIAPEHYDFLASRADGSPIRLDASVSSTIVDGRTLIVAIAHPVVRSQPVEPQEPSGVADLSRREREVMDLILAGKRPKEIALLLGIHAKTVATLRARMLRKLGLGDTRTLFQYGVRHGLIDWN